MFIQIPVLSMFVLQRGCEAGDNKYRIKNRNTLPVFVSWRCGHVAGVLRSATRQVFVLCFTCCIRLSMAMNAPVLPTPALCTCKDRLQIRDSERASRTPLSFPSCETSLSPPPPPPPSREPTIIVPKCTLSTLFLLKDTVSELRSLPSNLHKIQTVRRKKDGEGLRLRNQHGQRDRQTWMVKDLEIGRDRQTDK